MTVGREVSNHKTMNKEKAIELIKEVKDSLFLTKGLYMGKDEHLMAYMDLNKLSYELLAYISESNDPSVGFASYGSVFGRGVAVRSGGAFDNIFNGFTFADGVPFGVKED